MRRTLLALIVAALVAAGLVGTRRTLDAQTSQPPQSAPKSPPAQACEPSGPNGALVKELVKILDETQSPDTLLVTVGLLAEMKADAKLAVPAAIRAAERLQVFGTSLVSSKNNQEDSTANELAELLMELVRREDKGGRVRACCAPQPPMLAPAYTGSTPAGVVVPPTDPLVVPSPTENPPTPHVVAPAQPPTDVIPPTLKPTRAPRRPATPATPATSSY